mgnify:CR=1 FL=1
MASVLVSVALFAAALGALLVAADAFTDAAERLGLATGVSPFLVGATVVAGGTSLPELVSGVVAAAADAPDIVFGTVVGSNVANLCLVVGLAAVVGGELRVDRELMRVDLPLLVASAVFLTVAVLDGAFAWYEGVLGLAGLAVYVHFTLSREERLDEVVGDLVEEHVREEVAADGEVAELDDVADEVTLGPRTVALLVASLAVVVVAADQLVRSILEVAEVVGVGSGVVSMTAVALGTSLPEVAVSVAAVRRGMAEIALGNVLGSNVFNTFAVVGVPSFLGTLAVATTVATFAVPVMLLATLLYYFVTQDREITRWEGLALLLLYATFVANLPL